MDQQKYSHLLYEDLDFHSHSPYGPIDNSIIHSWYLIPESCSVNWATNLIIEVTKTHQIDYVFDPFMGSGSTGLACMKLQIPFLGTELKEDLVLSSRAKLMHKSIDPKRLLIDLASLSVPSHINYGNQFETLEHYSFDLTNQIIELDTHLSHKYLLTTVLFCLFNNNTNLDRRIVVSQMKFIVNNFLDQIYKSNFEEVDFSIHHQDCTRIDLEHAALGLNLSKPLKGLLVTSPTFISTAQKNTRYVELNRKISRLVLDSESSNINRQKHPKLANLDLSAIPEPALNHIKLVAKTLTAFDNSNQSKIAIIENENTIVEGQLIESDLYIAEVAERLGYTVDSIKVTHYVKSPGKIQYKWTDKRGSIITLHKHD